MMLKPAVHVLKDLAQCSNVSLHSDSGLVGAVAAAATDDDKRRAKKQADDNSVKDEVLRRKPELHPIGAWGDKSSQLTSWDVLHVLSRAIALS
ncbi:hypothetical protein [Amycolatopsis decaplanina]|uniref:Uncharacterized protein n=1 Tax=Amycolatopsis decaplanina DSM 44594 TaxID=1284240 RepID=M2Y8D5_9PSEU|nr:hypothetical protein H074_37093 [Amycolatopsis decaplanina DSM 44594]